MLCQISQRTNLKANHNYGSGMADIALVVPNIAKNKSESKSQRPGMRIRACACCAKYRKEQI